MLVKTFLRACTTATLRWVQNLNLRHIYHISFFLYFLSRLWAFGFKAEKGLNDPVERVFKTCTNNNQTRIKVKKRLFPSRFC